MSVAKIIKNKIKPFIDSGNDRSAINRLFCFDECHAFLSDKDKGFELLDAVANKFNIPLRNVHIVGSAQLGYSFVNSRNFVPGVSDLDIAIVDTALFLKYYELCYTLTREYRDLSSFPKTNVGSSRDTANAFRAYLTKGYFRPDYMPLCPQRSDWMRFFAILGNKYSSQFKKISCGIYMSSVFFTAKQNEIIEMIKKEP